MSHLELSATSDTITATVTVSAPDDVAWCEAAGDDLAVVELAADQPVTLRIVGPPAVLRAVLLDAWWQLGGLQ